MPATNPYAAFQMPNMNQNEQGGWGYEGANLPYKDNATELGNKFGWADPRTQGMQTRDVVRYGNGQIMHGMNTGFNGLGSQIEDGFTNFSANGGGNTYGSGPRNYSPQSGNWGGSNPFMIGSF